MLYCFPYCYVVFLGCDQPSARMGGWKLSLSQILRQSDADGD